MMQKGFTLFIAIVITATLLLISTGVISVAVKEAFLTSANRQSQEAFYAADSGIECVLYWDLKNPSGESAFATTTTSNITCNGQSFGNGEVNGPVIGGVTGQTNFTITFPPNKYCVEVQVIRRRAQPSATPRIYSTTIESLGYNDCDTTNPRRVQRAIRVVY